MAPLLSAVGVSFSFAKDTAVILSDVNFSVEPGQIVGLFGPNGSGKTTLLNLVTGLLVPTHGQLAFEGLDLEGAPPWARHQLGISRLFQDLRGPEQLRVAELLELGVGATSLDRLLPLALQPRATHRERESLRVRAQGILHRLEIAELAEKRVSYLSYGQKKLASIATSLISRPRLLLLDEPAAGLHSSYQEVLQRELGRLQAERSSVLIVEHDRTFLSGVCDRVLIFSKTGEVYEATDESW